MEPSRSIYDSPRLAAQYAHDRPPVHPPIIRAIGEHLRLGARVGRALDIGCGAGLSTAALEPLAEAIVGIEPVRTMLTHRRAVAPHALFLVGQAETLPFSVEAFGLLTAAGSWRSGSSPSSGAIQHLRTTNSTSGAWLMAHRGCVWRRTRNWRSPCRWTWIRIWVESAITRGVSEAERSSLTRRCRPPIL
jgi:SAM-dependent methyltransferase